MDSQCISLLPYKKVRAIEVVELQLNVQTCAPSMVRKHL